MQGEVILVRADRSHFLPVRRRADAHGECAEVYVDLFTRVSLLQRQVPRDLRGMVTQLHSGDRQCLEAGVGVQLGREYFLSISQRFQVQRRLAAIWGHLNGGLEVETDPSRTEQALTVNGSESLTLVGSLDAASNVCSYLGELTRSPAPLRLKFRKCSVQPGPFMIDLGQFSPDVRRPASLLGAFDLIPQRLYTQGTYTLLGIRKQIDDVQSLELKPPGIVEASRGIKRPAGRFDTSANPRAVGGKPLFLFVHLREHGIRGKRLRGIHWLITCHRQRGVTTASEVPGGTDSGEQADLESFTEQRSRRRVCLPDYGTAFGVAPLLQGICARSCRSSDSRATMDSSTAPR